jgi:hypothetical protein
LAVELRIKVVGLKGQDAAEGAAVSRKPPVSPEDVITISDGGGDIKEKVMELIVEGRKLLYRAVNSFTGRKYESD